jgi:cysteine desulfurase/selenocysteine lyase
MTDQGELRLDLLPSLLSPKTRLVAVTHVSNSLGTVNPVSEIARLAHQAGALVLVDGAQGAAHLGADVEALGADFYALSAHKLYGPTGVGLLWGRRELLNAMPPYQGGGDMITSVTFEKTHYRQSPARFEAGTPDIAGVIGLGAALGYIEKVGLEKAAAHEDALLKYGTALLQEIPGVHLVGTARHKVAVLSFTIDGVHPHDIGTILDKDGVAIRAGHHCAQPVMDRLGIPATARASLALYNTSAELDALAASVRKVIKIFK